MAIYGEYLAAIELPVAENSHMSTIAASEISDIDTGSICGEECFPFSWITDVDFCRIMINVSTFMVRRIGEDSSSLLSTNNH
jgi:hypothetical protein